LEGIDQVDGFQAGQIASQQNDTARSFAIGPYQLALQATAKPAAALQHRPIDVQLAPPPPGRPAAKAIHG
jgi:hypothetical protein